MENRSLEEHIFESSSLGTDLSTEILSTLEPIPNFGTIILIHRINQTILGCLTLIGNAFTLTAISTFRELRNQPNLIVTSLAVADFCVGIRNFLFVIEWLLADRLSVAVKKLFDFVRPWSIYTSICHIVLIAVDRYVAVVHPFFYQKHFSENVTKCMIVVTWIVAALLVFSHWIVGFLLINGYIKPLDPFHYEAAVQFIIYFIVTASLVLLYTKITVIARKQKRQIEAMEIRSAAENEQSEGDQTDKEVSNQKRTKKGDDKATKMFTLVIGAFEVFFFPYFIYLITRLQQGGMTEVASYTYYIGLNIVECNSTVNILIYGYTNSKFRAAYKKLICCNSRPNTIDDLSYSFSQNA